MHWGRRDITGTIEANRDERTVSTKGQRRCLVSLKSDAAVLTRGARLHRLRKNSAFDRFVSGHDFSRADKLSISHLSRLEPTAQNWESEFFRNLFRRTVDLGLGSPALAADVKQSITSGAKAHTALSLRYARLKGVLHPAGNDHYFKLMHYLRGAAWRSRSPPQAT